ncbi:MAG: hypothetical protein B6245_21265 [Desulfobacteraceae bacterium 4572_88]|nr:MAG: hypothetical protein B6245_21265 [Desulfobacteraceae bacterium 4572_88]
MGRFWVDDRVISEHGQNIGIYGVGIMALLCRYAGADGGVDVPESLIAEKLRISKRTVQRTLPILEAKGLIRIIRSKGRSNRIVIRNEYLRKSSVSVARVTGDSASQVTGDSVSRVTGDSVSQTGDPVSKYTYIKGRKKGLLAQLKKKKKGGE